MMPRPISSAKATRGAERAVMNGASVAAGSGSICDASFRRTGVGRVTRGNGL
jgi:acyl-CoA synthetase (NDP forming)